jgi:chromosome segregation ATPase
MGGEQVESLSDDLTRWLDEKAEELGTTRADVVSRAVTAYRLVDENEDAAAEATVASDADALEARVDELESTFRERLTDVRERVVQVKRESDAKAPADHDHPDLSERVDSLDETVDALERRVAEGFENYEEILEYLTETTDGTSEKLDTLATAVVDLRRRAGELEHGRAERAAGAELRREANQLGVEKATCEHCDSSVLLGLLDGPYCPHCGSTFERVTPKRGLFGSATLSTGRRPALERPESNDEDAPGDLFETDEAG